MLFRSVQFVLRSFCKRQKANKTSRKVEIHFSVSFLCKTNCTFVFFWLIAYNVNLQSPHKLEKWQYICYYEQEKEYHSEPLNVADGQLQQR